MKFGQGVYWGDGGWRAQIMEVVGGKRVAGLGVLGAVFYTHLRAHETVLELVCRLLLEKKKTYAVFYFKKKNYTKI